jgi:hypothetical protein
VLIPCSKTAAAVKKGKAEIEIPEAEYTGPQREAAAKLRVLDAEAQKGRAVMEGQRDSALKEQDRRAEAALGEVRKESEKRAAEARRAIEEDRAAQARQIERESAQFRGELAAVDAATEPALQAARTDAGRKRTRIAGLKGCLSVELPALAVFSVPLLLTGTLNEYSGPLALVGALAAGRLFRTVVAARAIAPVRRAEMARAAAREKCEESSGVRASAIRESFAGRIAGNERVIAEAAHADSDAREANRRRRETIAAEWDAKIKSATQANEERRKPLLAALRRTVVIKDLSRKTEFRAYQAAREGGFKEGLKPSDWEMKPTDAERAQAELQFLLRRRY